MLARSTIAPRLKWCQILRWGRVGSKNRLVKNDGSGIAYQGGTLRTEAECGSVENKRSKPAMTTKSMLKRDWRSARSLQEMYIECILALAVHSARNVNILLDAK